MQAATHEMSKMHIFMQKKAKPLGSFRTGRLKNPLRPVLDRKGFQNALTAFF
jgi:hypothetical protein